MADHESGDKTEEPTPRRRQEAREEGQIARSSDLTAALAILAGVLLMRALGGYMLEGLLGMTRALGEPPAVTMQGLLPWIRRVGLGAVKVCAPFMALLFVITVAGTAVQSGLVMTWKKLGLKFDRIDPVRGFKRLFSLDALSRLVLGLLKVTVVGAIGYLTIMGQLGTVLSAGGLHPGGVFSMGADMIFTLAVRMSLALLILGLMDYFFQRWKLERQLRMTKQEVRDELRKMEGDPLVKQRRRQMQARLAQQRIRAEVPRADVVVTNPTHFAVAIRYDEQRMTAPRVTAKGRDFLAQRIREVALQHGVPVVERPPLARALYNGVEVGQEIPPAFYRAVAELLAYVYQLSGRAAG
jgi:flagellar biosynthetic protein FlhB